MAQWTKAVCRFTAPILRNRKGSISVLAAFSITAVVGFAGLGTEVAYWYVKERNLQSAADSAAIAAATAMMGGDTSTNATTAADTLAAQYGFSGGDCGQSNATVVCVNNPPATGSHTGDNKAWEVIVTQTQPRLFTGLFMSSDPQLGARAVATQIGVSAPSCVVTLDKTSLQPDLVDTGTASLNIPNCNVFIDSCDTTANQGALQVGGNSTYVANQTYMCGALATNGHPTFTDENGTFQRTGTTYADPYASTSPPSPGPCNQTNMAPISTNTSLTPGTYCGGLAINGGNIDLAPGTYIIDGTSTNLAQGGSSVGLEINGQAVVGCSVCSQPGSSAGVTFVLTGSGATPSGWAAVQINGGADVTLPAPMPGASSGIPPFVFYQDRNAPPGGISHFNGNATDNFSGAMYFPTQKVIYNGNSNATGGKCTQLVVYQAQFNGTNNFSSDTFNCKDQGIVSLNAPGGIAVALVE